MAATQLTISPSPRFGGRLAVPGDKSISHRYVMFGALADGTTSVTGLAPGADVASTIACMHALGASIHRTGPGALEIKGRGKYRLAPADGERGDGDGKDDARQASCAGPVEPEDRDRAAAFRPAARSDGRAAPPAPQGRRR